MEKAIRVGIVGSGNAAVFHYASYLRVTGIPVKVVGVTSLDKTQCENFAREPRDSGLCLSLRDASRGGPHRQLHSRICA